MVKMNKRRLFFKLAIFSTIFLIIRTHSYVYPPVSGEKMAINVSIDGFITEDEYENSQFLDSLSTYKLSYTIEGDEIFIGIEGKALGWVALGLSPNDPATTRHLGADIIMGAFLSSSGSPNSADKYGASEEDIKTDSRNDILSFSASQNSTWTTFEFSRKLTTGDSRDKNITPDVGQVVMWAYHRSSDSFGEHHTSNGYTFVIFHADKYIPPEIPDPDVGGFFNVSVDGFISSNEYPYSLYMDGQFQFKLYYGITNNTIFLALEVQTNGWVALGFQTNNPTTNKHSGADIVLGAYNSQSKSTVYRDDYGDSSTTHKEDTILGGTADILEVSASEDSSVTILEFSRKLDTGDTYDQVIIPEVPIYVMWAYHISIDDMETVHSAKGYNLLTFHENNADINSSAPTFPFAPQGLSGVVENGNVVLNWISPAFDGNSPIKNYNLYRRLYNETKFSFIGVNSSNFSFIDKTVTENLAYYYTVRSENSVGESINSNEFRINLVTEALNSNVLNQDKNENQMETKNQESFYDIPFGLGWAFSIPVIYAALFLGLIGAIKLKRLNLRNN